MIPYDFSPDPGCVTATTGIPCAGRSIGTSIRPPVTFASPGAQTADLAQPAGLNIAIVTNNTAHHPSARTTRAPRMLLTAYSMQGIIPLMWGIGATEEFNR